MKVSELIEKLSPYEEFEVEFEVEFVFTDGYSKFPNVRSFAVEGIADIGHSDKVVLLSGEER